jgi:hypothetical protein
MRSSTAQASRHCAPAPTRASRFPRQRIPRAAARDNARATSAPGRRIAGRRRRTSTGFIPQPQRQLATHDLRPGNRVRLSQARRLLCLSHASSQPFATRSVNRLHCHSFLSMSLANS